jgi:hypothetical protein
MDPSPQFSCPMDDCNINITQAVREQSKETTVTRLFTLEQSIPVLSPLPNGAQLPSNKLNS